MFSKPYSLFWEISLNSQKQNQISMDNIALIFSYTPGFPPTKKAYQSWARAEACLRTFVLMTAVESSKKKKPGSAISQLCWDDEPLNGDKPQPWWKEGSWQVFGFKKMKEWNTSSIKYWNEKSEMNSDLFDTEGDLHLLYCQKTGIRNLWQLSETVKNIQYKVITLGRDMRNKAKH